MESQQRRVSVDVPNDTFEEATTKMNGTTTEPNNKTEPSKGMLKNPSTAARFQVAPVSAGKNKDAEESDDADDPASNMDADDPRPTKVGFADADEGGGTHSVGVKFDIPPTHNHHHTITSLNSNHHHTITSQNSKLSDTIGPGDTYYGTQKTYGAYMTEAFPNVGHYRNLLSATADPNLKPRPTLEELHGDKKEAAEAREAAAEVGANGRVPVENGDVEAGTVEVAKFGWIVGVLIRCLLNIWGVMLFLRLSWVVGEAGVGLASVVVLLASVVTTLTTISMSAISTNGVVKGGGAYFMISRSLGPEFGGAIGLIFSLANAVGVAMYIVGFCETVRDIMKDKAFNGVWMEELSEANLIRILGIGTAFILLIIVIVGLDFEAKMQVVMLFILVLSMVDILIGTFIPASDRKERGFEGYSGKLFTENFVPAFSKEQDFFTVFSIFFPAATGILAGANISGDLKDAQTAIPKGTLLAIVLSTIVYIGLAWIIGATVRRNAPYGCVPKVAAAATASVAQQLATAAAPTLVSSTSSNATASMNDSVVAASNVTICDYGLYNDYQVAELMSAFGPIVTAGIFAATLSSALASLVGAPKVFQAVCKDRIFPKLDWFGEGVGANDEPRRAYILCFVISVIFILIGDLDTIAPIISNFFLMAYCLINYSCFDASLTNSPGWRPAFKYYNKWLSLLGALLCLAVMFIINWWTALLTFAIISAIWLFVRHRKLDINWGSSTQAHVYKSALKHSLDLSKVEEHVKNYRPQVLLLCGKPSDRPAIVDFCNTLTKGNSLLILGNVITDESSFPKLQKAEAVNTYLKKRKIKAFYQPMIHPVYNQGVYALLQVTGLGKLKPNVVFMGYSGLWHREKDENALLDHFSVIHHAFDLNFSVAIMRVSQGFDASSRMDASTAEALEKNSPSSLDETNETHFVEEMEMAQDPKVGFVANNDNNDKVQLELQEVQPLNSTSGVNSDLLNQLNVYRNKQKPGYIDVWWLFDDGGLTLLIPFILKNRKLWERNKLRIFSVGSKMSRVNKDQQQLTTLLSKFRIPIEDVTVLPDIAQKPSKESVAEFHELIAFWKLKDGESKEDKPWKISDEDLKMYKEKINTHLRTRELFFEYSCKKAVVGGDDAKGAKSQMETNLIVLTLPIPRKNGVPAALYMSWLEFLSRDVPENNKDTLRMPPVLFVRGNQTSVLTYYS